MREPEGIETLPPGKSSERTWSKRREPDIRNVEAEGSSPFTSTKGPGHGAKVESPNVTTFVGVTLRDLIGHMTSESRRCSDLIDRRVGLCWRPGCSAAILSSSLEKGSR